MREQLSTARRLFAMHTLAPLCAAGLIVELRDIERVRARALVLIEQYVKRAHELADQVVVLSYGQVAMQRPAAEVTLAEIEESYELELTDSAGGARPGLDAPAARSFVDAVGGEPRAKYGWTDVARFAVLGIPAVNYGPGDPRLAHTRDEHVSLDQVRATEQRLRAWLTA